MNYGNKLYICSVIKYRSKTEEYGYYTKAITCRYNIVSIIHYQFEIVMANLLNLITLIFSLGTGEILIILFPVVVIGILLIVLLYKLIKKL